MPVSSNRVFELLDSKMRVILCDKRTFIGHFKAYDKYMNIVLQDAVEYKKYKPAKTKTVVEVKKNYGVIILRGDSISSIIVESTDSSYEHSSSSGHHSSSSAYHSRKSYRR